MQKIIFGSDESLEDYFSEELECKEGDNIRQVPIVDTFLKCLSSIVHTFAGPGTSVSSNDSNCQ